MIQISQLRCISQALWQVGTSPDIVKTKENISLLIDMKSSVAMFIHDQYQFCNTQISRLVTFFLFAIFSLNNSWAMSPFWGSIKSFTIAIFNTVNVSFSTHSHASRLISRSKYQLRAICHICQTLSGINNCKSSLTIMFWDAWLCKPFRENEGH